MQSISYTGAALSCLPIVGPVIGLYNEYRTREEISSLRNTWQQANENFATELSEISRKGCAYSTCAVIGNVLTVAVAVGLFVLGVFSSLAIITTIGFFTCVAFMHAEDALTYSHGNVALRRPFL